MKDFRCAKCNKLLGKIEGRAIIKCPRCKEINMVELSAAAWREVFKDLYTTPEQRREIFGDSEVEDLATICQPEISE
jgi:phage FluMu protein Com